MNLKSILGRLNIKSFTPSLPFWSGPINNGRVRSFNSKDEQLAANLGWVFAGNDIRAEMAASVPVKLIDKQKNEVVESHPLLDTLNNPNGVLSGYQLKKLFFVYKGLTGETYWLKSDEVDSLGVPLALHVLPSHLANFHLEKTLQESFVQYGTERYSLDKIVRSIDPDPLNPYYGRGIVAASAGSIDADLSAVEFNRHFFANQARPSSVINIKNQLSDDARRRFKQEIEAMYTGTGNAGKPMLLEGDLTVTPYMLTQREMDYLNSRKFGKDEILAMFKVSPGMLGMVENVNRSNMEASDTIFAKSVLVPELTSYVNTLNTQYIPEKLRRQYEFTFDSPVPEDHERITAMLSAGVGRWITPNEAREQLGLPPIDGQDSLDQAEPILPEIPDNSKELAEIKTELKTLQQQGLKKKLYSTTEEREELGELYAGIRTKRLDAFESGYAVASRQYFDLVKKDTLAKVNQSKKQFKRKGIDDLVPNMSQYIKPYIALMLPVYEDLMGREGAIAFALATGASDFDIDDPDVQKYMDSRSTKVAKDVNAETEKQLRATLSQGLTAKETTAELAARVEEVLGIQASARAKRIARTEATRTSTEAQIQAWDQSGVVSGKEWYTVVDERRCEFCRSMDGRKVGLKSKYYKQGSVFTGPDGGKLKLDYEDVVGPAIHPNCRCTLLPILED